MKKYFNLKKISIIFLVLRYSIYTIRFNFENLPFKKAIIFPFIFESSAKFYSLKGKISLEAEKIKTGMIRFKSRNIGVYDSNQRFVFENHGHIIFKGKSIFKSGSAVSVGPKGILSFGDNVSIGPLNKIVCTNSIKIGANSLFAWEVMLIDSDFHWIYDLKNKTIFKNSSEIEIGDNCWIGTRSILYKGTKIPNNVIVGGMSLLNKEYKIENNCLLAGNPATVKKNNIVRLLDDNISELEIYSLNQMHKFN